MVHCNEDSDYLSIIEKALAKSGIATNIVVVRNSRVPLVRFRHVVCFLTCFLYRKPGSTSTSASIKSPLF